MAKIFKNFFDNSKNIENRGIGKKIGILETNLGKYTLYEKRINLIESINNPGTYGVIISRDIYYLKDNELVENNEEEIMKMIYFGFDKNEAINSFNKIIEDDKNEKLNLVHKLFSKN